MNNSLIGDGACSWVLIVNGINKYVTEITAETHENHVDNRRHCRKTCCQNKTETNVNADRLLPLPYHQREWIDVEPGQYDKSCFEVSNNMIRLLRHDPSGLREGDGAVEFRILAPMFRSEFT